MSMDDATVERVRAAFAPVVHTLDGMLFSEKLTVLATAAITALAPDFAAAHAAGLEQAARWHDGRRMWFDRFGSVENATIHEQSATGIRALILTPQPPVAYQRRIDTWMRSCFTPQVVSDARERSHRFFEEAAELVQAAGTTASEAHQIVDYVFGRPVGELNQEVGGVMVCLAALCTAHRLDMAAAGETELFRVWRKIGAIQAKHAAKPQFSPLPGPIATPQPDPQDAEIARLRSALRRARVSLGIMSPTVGVAATASIIDAALATPAPDCAEAGK